MKSASILRLIQSAAVAGAVLFAASAWAQSAPPAGAVGPDNAPVRIAFINTERVLKDSSLAKAAQQKLEQEFAKRDKELQDMAAKIKSANDALQKNGPVMSDADRIKAQQNIVDLNREFQRKQREFGEDLNARRNEALASVLDKANKVVRELAQKDHYDIIFQDAVYVNPRLDITDKVIKALDATASSSGK